MAAIREDAAPQSVAVTSEGDMLFGSSDPPLADQRSVMVAETGLEWQDNGQPALLQVGFCLCIPARGSDVLINTMG